MNPVLKDNFFGNKFSQNRKTIIHENIKFLDKAPKKNLPELKLTKLKMRPGSDPDTEYNTLNKISRKTGLKYVPIIPKIQKNHTLIKKTELMFPKIKNALNNIPTYGYNELERNMIVTNYNNNNFLSNNINNYKSSSKRKNIHSTRNAKTKTFYGSYGINNINNINNVNNINNININMNNINNMNNLNNNQSQNKNNYNEKINDIEKNNIDTFNHNNKMNYAINLHKVKSKIPRYPRGNKSMPSRVTTKIKKYKKEKTEKNVVDTLTIKPLINYPQNNNYLPPNNIYNNNNNNLKNNSINSINDSTNNSNNLFSSNISSSSTLNSFKATPTSLPTTNNFSQYEFMEERLNLLQNLFSSLSSLTGRPNPLFELNNNKIVELSPEIFRNTYKNFFPSITSSSEQFTNDDVIKGYAQNSSMGNIRDYNEDTITATKIILNNEKENFYFFGVYDGHGGSGCSTYLKNNLHNFIKNFSKESFKEAISEAEEKYLKYESLDEKGELKDQSGSCGIMAIIQKNKCIIANVGDSRLVVYKKNSVFFATEDHKPGSKTEKERITKAGGQIYQTPSLFPLYQNGKEIEIPWRVLPGRLSVSRTFGDVEAKNEKFGGNKNVVVALPDMTEIELSEDFNLIVLGCDGIFDVLTNEEILECVKIVLKEKNIKEINDEVNISELCGYFADMIIKSSLAKDSFDNVSCVVIAINIKPLIN